MTQTEYEQQKRECWKEFCKEHPLDATANGGVAFRFAFDRAYTLGKQEKEADTVIQGWVARDIDGEIYLYENKPERGSTEWLGRLSSEFDLQRVTWSDDPIEVELIIKRKKNE